MPLPPASSKSYPLSAILNFTPLKLCSTQYEIRFTRYEIIPPKNLFPPNPAKKPQKSVLVNVLKSSYQSVSNKSVLVSVPKSPYQSVSNKSALICAIRGCYFVCIKVARPASADKIMSGLIIKSNKKFRIPP